MTKKPHDALFKATYKIKSEVIAHLKNFNKEIADNIDLDSLTLDDTSYVNDTLDELFSDVVYNCVWGSNTPIKITLLFEHKSYYDKHLPIQLFIYIGQIWARQLKSGEAPTIILPIVLYHGKEKFQYRRIEDFFEPIDEKLSNYIPKFEYSVTDLHKFSDKDLMNLQKTILRTTISVFKHKGDLNYVKKNFQYLLQFENYSYERFVIDSFFVGLISYIWKAYDAGEKDWEELKNQIPSNLNDLKMTIAQSYIEKGIEKGMAKGIEKGINKGKLEMAEIGVKNLFQKFPELSDVELATILTVSPEFVSEIRKKVAMSSEPVANESGARNSDSKVIKIDAAIRNLIIKLPKMTDSEIADVLEIKVENVQKVRKGLTK